MLLRSACILTIPLIPLLLAAGPTTYPTTQPVTRPYTPTPEAPLKPTEKLVSTEPKWSVYRIEFNGINPATRVPANLYIPRNARAPYPAVLLQYGAGGNKNTRYIVAIAQIAAEKGMAVLTIDAPNRGERKGKDQRITFADTNFFQYLGDYSRAVDYLCQRRDVDAGRIAYVGISWGAITGITYAAHDPRIQCLVSLVGGGNFASLIPLKPSDSTIQQIASYDPCYHIGFLAPRPILMINAKRDQIIPPLMSESLQNAAPAYTKKEWLDTDHIFTGTDREAICRSVIDFVLESLPKVK